MRGVAGRAMREGWMALPVAVLLVVVVLGSAGGARATQAAAPSATLGQAAQHRHAGAGVLLGARLGAVAAAAGSGDAAIAAARANELAVRGDRVRVILTGPEAAAAATAAGGTVEAKAAGKTQALVPVSALDELSADARTKTIRPPARYELATVTGEGVGASNAAAYHTAGHTGQGVKVGIIDGGFAGYQQRISEGELPAVTTADFCGGQLATATPHGTAVAEIVHEMAPGAALYLICMNSEVTLAQAEQYAKQQGITIINHSVGWFNTSRGDGSGGPGTPDAIVADARANGIVWVNAAGNEGTRHWSGTFVDTNGDGVHEFAGGNVRNPFNILPGARVCASLRWDAWPSTTEDYDLFLIDSANTILAGSATDQSVAAGQPVEEVCYQNPSSSVISIGAAITKYAATTTPRFDLFVDGDLGYQTQGSVIEPASSPAAIAVGASCFGGDDPETYSSRGPTIDGRPKPELIAADGVAGATYGPTGHGCSVSGFPGTSAAAPHVAGALALIKQNEPSLSVPALETMLLQNATTLYGVDRDDTGAGEVSLDLPTPASSEIVFAEENPVGTNGWRIWLSADNGEGAVLLTTGNIERTAPKLSPDGSKIVFQRRQAGGAYRIATMNIDGTNETLNPLFPGSTDNQVPVWSPDGSKIAFVARIGADNQIVVTDANGSNPVQLTSGSTRNLFPAWSPDGSKIYFTSNRDDPLYSDVYRMNADGSTVVRLTASVGLTEYMPMPSPAGTKLAWATDGFEITVANADGSNPVSVTGVVAPAWLASWSPDGTELLISTASNLARVKPDGSNLRILARPGLHNAGADWHSGLRAPRSLATPQLAGDATATRSLVALRGSWLGGSYRMSYQWQRCDGAGANCADIGGATDRAYKLGASDLGARLRCRLTASNSGGTTSATSPTSSSVGAAPTPPNNPGSGGGGGSGGGSGRWRRWRRWGWWWFVGAGSECEAGREWVGVCCGV